MLSQLKQAADVIRNAVADLDSDRIDVNVLSEFVETFAEIERLATAGRTLIARQVEKSGVWWRSAYRTPAQWMASRAQTTIAAAVSTLETARKLDELPATREVFASGALSGLQAAEITRAASADPAAERTLLEASQTESVAALRQRCREITASAQEDDDADERIHRSRYFRHWSDPDGAVRVDGRFAPDAGARFIASVEARQKKLMKQARAAGSNERREAYAADAVISLADESTPGPRAVVHVHVDEGAWRRGRLEKGEICRIPGQGPISVPAARRLAEQGIVKTVLTDGADVRGVAHLGRTIPARLRTALEARDQTCVVPGCDQRDGLEIDHILPLAEGGPTRLDNLARLCAWHHSLKTHRRWRLQGGPGRWEWFRQSRAASRGPPG